MNPPDWPDPDAMARALHDMFAPLQAVFADLGRALAASFKQLEPLLDGVEQERKARVQRMHTAYGRRRR